MRRIAVVVILVLVAAVSVLTASLQQAPVELPAFDVVSIRPGSPDERGGAISGPTPGQFRVANIPLRNILLYAFQVRDVQLLDAPEWTRTERFHIQATYPPGVGTEDHHLRLQRVLAERFGLVVRREVRELPVYQLVLARADRTLGPKLTPSNVDCARYIADGRPQVIGTGTLRPGGARPGCLMVGNSNNGFVIGGTRPLSALARSLEGAAERPVVDATGLSGNFDIELQWTPPAIAGSATGGAPVEAVSLFTAIQEQLGLKLEPAAAPLDVVVIDRVERPTGN